MLVKQPASQTWHLQTVETTRKNIVKQMVGMESDQALQIMRALLDHWKRHWAVRRFAVHNVFGLAQGHGGPKVEFQVGDIISSGEVGSQGRVRP
jgi:hypothetical protein